MDRTRNELFACSSFALNQNSRVCRGHGHDLVQGLFQSPTGADDSLETVARSGPLVRTSVVFQENFLPLHFCTEFFV